MSNGAMFTIGAALGAVLGGVGTYFFMKDKMEEQIAEEIDNYIQYSNKKKEKAEKFSEEKIEETPANAEEPKEEKVYKYYKGSLKDLEISTDRSKDVIGVGKVKQEIKETVEEKEEVKEKEKPDPFKNDPNLEEITEDEYIDGYEDYEQTTLDYIFRTDALFYGYGTDNQELAEGHFNDGREAIIGQLWRYASDYINEEEDNVGVAYVRNQRLKYDFEVILHGNWEIEPDEDDDEE